MKYKVGDRVTVEMSKGIPSLGVVVQTFPGDNNEQPMYNVEIPRGTHVRSWFRAFFEDEVTPAGDVQLLSEE